MLYPICMLLIWLPSVFLGVVANQATAVPAIQAKLEARADAGRGRAGARRRANAIASAAQAGGDDVILRLVEGYAPTLLAALLGAAVMAAVMASDSQILALSTMFTEDVFAFYGGTQALRRRGAGAHRTAVRDRADAGRLSHRAADAAVDLRPGHAVRVRRLRGAVAAAGRGALLARQHEVGRAREHGLDGGRRRRPSPSSRPRCRRRRRVPSVPILSIGGIDVVTRAATGMMVFGLLPVVPMTLDLGAADGRRVDADAARAPRTGDAGEILRRVRTYRRAWTPRASAAPLTPLQWLICAVAALGFAFDSYELLMLPLIVRPALAELLGVAPNSLGGQRVGRHAAVRARRSPAASSACSAATSPTCSAAAACWCGASCSTRSRRLFAGIADVGRHGCSSGAAARSSASASSSSRRSPGWRSCSPTRSSASASSATRRRSDRSAASW